MAHLPYAFSIHHFISSVGADAGFASIVGLAILVLLFFAQARETTSLRDQLAEAGERVQALEARLSQTLRSGAAAPAPSAQAAIANQPAASSGAPSGAAPARVGAAAAVASRPASQAVATSGPATVEPGAPPGVGAPAQGAATRLIPDITTVRPPVTAAATAAGAAGAAAAGAGGTGSGPRTDTPTPSPAPAPVAANGSATSPPAEPPPRIQIRPGAAAAPSRRPPAGSHLASTGRLAPAPRARRVLIAVLALLGIAAAVIVLLVLTSGGGSSRTVTTTSASGAPPARPRHHRSPTTSVVPGSVTVAVLNGTATNGLAHRVAVKLTGGGFRQGNITTAVDQTRTATTVAYLPGQRKAALAVASTLNLGSASVAPADQTSRTVACQGLSPAACSAQTVIVTVGSDLANIR